MRNPAGSALFLVLLFTSLASFGQASADESDELSPIETGQSPTAKPASVPATVDTICNALAAPATATWRGLSDPFDPLESIAQSAKLLRDLRREFGNLGLAAAAYNAGFGRVRDWLAGRRGLPKETDAYVRIVTGYSPEQWAGPSAGMGEMKSENPVPCGEIAAFVARAPPPASKPT